MKVINLRLHYPHYQQDKLVEVSEEVFDVLCQSVREMRNYERRKRYHRAFYSLDAFEWTENYALEHSPSPEQLVTLAEERAERDRLAAALREALAYATPHPGPPPLCLLSGRADPAADRRPGARPQQQRVSVHPPWPVQSPPLLHRPPPGEVRAV